MAEVAKSINDITTHDFTEIIDWTIAKGLKQPILGLGAPGIGKSEMIAQIAKKYGYGLKDLRLAQMSEVEIAGLIYPSADHTKTQWLIPDWFEWLNSNNGGKNILLLDEITSATKRVQVAAYQLVLDRQVGSHKLNDNVIIIALGNRRDDNGVFVEMAAPLANRFEIYNVVPDFDIWNEDYASVHVDSNGKAFNGTVISFLAENPDRLHTQHLLTESSMGDEMSFATPRSWSRVSDILNAMTDDEITSGIQGVIARKIKGNLGSKVGSEFVTYYSRFQGLTVVQDLLNGKTPMKLENKSQQIYAIHGVMSSFSGKYEKYKDGKVSMGDLATLYGRVLKWADSDLSPEYKKKIETFFDKKYSDVVMEYARADTAGFASNILNSCKDNVRMQVALGKKDESELDNIALKSSTGLDLTESGAFQII